MKKFLPLVSALVAIPLALDGCTRWSNQPASFTKDEVEYLETSGVTMGGGINTLNGSAAGTCIEVPELEQSFPSDSQNTVADLVRIQSSTDLENASNFNAQGKISGLWGSVSAKASLSHSKTLQDYSISLLAYSRVTNSIKVMKTTPKLKPEFAELLQSNPDAFYQACGDSYVDGVVDGAEFYALLTTNTSTSEEFKNASLAINASGWGAHIHGDASKVVMSKLSTVSFSINSAQKGGLEATSVPPISPEEVIARYRDLPNIAAANPRPFSLSIKPYDTIPSVAALGHLNIKKVRKDFGKARQRQSEFQRLYNNVNHVLENPTEFAIGTRLDELTALRHSWHDTVESLEDMLDDCSTTYSCDLDLSPLKVPDIALPDYTPTTVVKAAYCGGTTSSTTSIAFQPPLVHGDREFDGNGPSINISGKLVVREDKRAVEFVVDADFLETEGDASEAKGQKSFRVYDNVPDGWVIDSIEGTQSWPSFVNDVDRNTKPKDYEGSEVPGVFTVVGDTNGKDIENGTGFTGELQCSFAVRLKREI